MRRLIFMILLFLVFAGIAAAGCGPADPAPSDRCDFGLPEGEAVKELSLDEIDATAGENLENLAALMIMRTYTALARHVGLRGCV